MIKLKRILLCLFLFSSLFAKYHIVIVAGQSNCLNIHTRATALPSCESDTLVPFFYDLYYPPSFAPTHLVCSSDNSWEKLKVHKGDEDRKTSYEFFGPEMTLARTLLNHVDSIAIFKFGVAGSDLAYDWGLSVDGGPELFDKFIEKIRLAEKAMDSLDYDYEWYAATWMQGESDADNQQQAANYYRNLGHFMKCLRDTLQVPDLPIAVGAIADELVLNYYPYRETVLDAQRRRCEKDEYALLVNTADYNMDTDDVHFNSQGVMDLGEDFATAILTLKNGANSSTDSNPSYYQYFYPNPVNSIVNYDLNIPWSMDVKLELYNLLGHRLKAQHYGTLPAGMNNLNMHLDRFSTGIYIMKISAGSHSHMQKITLLK